MNKSFVYMQAILQSGSFSRAASELGISQPSLSQFIQRLEKDVGATLLDRQSRPLKLTAEGACWMEAETNVNRIREIYANRIREMSGRHSRHLRVGTLHYFEGFVFPEVLPKVLETLPDLDVQLTEDNAENLKKGLLEDRLDLAVLHCESCGQELTGELLFKERRLF